MSVGVVVLADWSSTRRARSAPAFDIEIVEMHHKHKVDAPSGTALQLGRGGRRGRGRRPRRRAPCTRATASPASASAGTIGFAALRGGDVVGEHTVVFAGDGERVELTHRATSRQNFAAGALRAAHFVAAKRAARRKPACSTCATCSV